MIFLFKIIHERYNLNEFKIKKVLILVIFTYKESKIVSVNMGGHRSNIWVFGSIRVNSIFGHLDIQ